MNSVCEEKNLILLSLKCNSWRRVRISTRRTRHCEINVVILVKKCSSCVCPAFFVYFFYRYEFTWGVVFLEHHLLICFSFVLRLHLGQNGNWKSQIKSQQCVSNVSKTRRKKYSRTIKESNAWSYLLFSNFGSFLHCVDCICKLSF